MDQGSSSLSFIHQGPRTRRLAQRRYRRWTIDYPRSDRHLLQGIRRLTRINTRSVEQIVDLDGTDDVYNWPVMYAVEVGYWRLTDDQAAQLARLSAPGRLFHVRRLPWHHRVGELHGEHEAGFFRTGQW